MTVSTFIPAFCGITFFFAAVFRFILNSHMPSFVNPHSPRRFPSFASFSSSGFTSAWNIYSKPQEFSACHYTTPPFPVAGTSASAKAVLMQIRPGESTYYKRLTFVLIYWIVSATESLKPDPLTSSFLSLLTLMGQAWQVELQQSSLIMWNKSICLEMVRQRQTAGDALILLLWCTASPPLQLLASNMNLSGDNPVRWQNAAAIKGLFTSDMQYLTCTVEYFIHLRAGMQRFCGTVVTKGSQTIRLVDEKCFNGRS